MNIYENMCKFGLYVKTIDKIVAPKENFESENNDEMKRLLKESKIANIGDRNESPSEKKKEEKPKKRAKKKKTFETEEDKEKNHMEVD